jgi:hypothetical protein
MPITIGSPRGETGVDSLYNTEEKIFEDIRANPGEKAFVFIHSVPFEGSVSLVNLLTSTRLVRKGFDVSIILYGPACCWPRGTAATRPSAPRASPGTWPATGRSRR